MAKPEKHLQRVLPRPGMPSATTQRGHTVAPSTIKKFLREWDLHIMIIPPLIFILIFNYIPMWGVLTAFQDYNLARGFFGSPWVGFKHFEMFFNSPDFWLIMRNSIAISLLKILFGFPAPIILALLLNEVRWMAFKRAVQTISYLPHFLSWVIVSAFVISMLSVDNGSLNMLLQSLRLIDEPVNWLSIPRYFWAILVATNIWKAQLFTWLRLLA
jgi:putative aldouronate transport system permease protein